MLGHNNEVYMLALVGSGEYLPGMDLVDEELLRRLPEPARVVCLPTAAGTEGDEIINSWANKGVAHFRRLGAEVEALPVVDRATAQDQTFAQRIASANFVYLSGGKPAYLYQSLVETPVWSAIVSVHQRGGIVAGCSAGAMIMGEKIMGLPKMSVGLALLPRSLIVPHFDEFPGILSRIIHLLTGTELTLFGVDGYTALVTDGQQFDVLGTGGVTVWHHRQHQRYTPGLIPDRIARQWA